MKYAFILFSAIIFLVSCDPPTALYEQGAIVLTATVMNPRDTINLGDSVCFVFDVPDTLTMNGKKYHPTYENIDGFGTDLNDCKMDTSLGSEYRSFSPECDTYANPGNTQGSFKLSIINGNKLYGRFYMIPKKRGVYFLWNQQAGYFSFNNGAVRGRVLLTLDVPDKHHTMLLNMVRPQNKVSFQTFLQNSENNKLPVYGFAVK